VIRTFSDLNGDYSPAQVPAMHGHSRLTPAAKSVHAANSESTAFRGPTWGR
jgi:hypothetical protein